MKVSNIRAGFATNSSSSHSIIMMTGGKTAETDVYNSLKYGWEQFTLADRSSKTDYVAAQLASAMKSSGLESDEYTPLINSWLETSYGVYELAEAYVDHQSQWRSLCTKPDSEFIKALYSLIMKDDVVILGGNDNDDPQDIPCGGVENDLANVLTQSSGENMVRVDGDHVVIFNQLSGNKIRFSVNDDAPDYVKSTFPELLDVKITDYCQYGCVFCYQGSTKSGKHADLNDIKKIIDACSEMEVFEIAYGGGEPTQHPQFAEILTYTGVNGIIPNFTTFGVDWLKNDTLVEVVKSYVGAIGVSVHSADQLSKVKKIQSAFTDSRKIKIVAQHVIGSVDMAVTALLLEECWKDGIDLLLLGYKDVGFGADVEKYDMEGIDTLLKLRQGYDIKWGARVSTLGVDTAFVQQFNPLLEEIGIPHVLKTNEEGKFSMYVDAVAKTQGPSSYMPDQMESINMTDIGNSIKTAYTAW